MTLRDVDSSRQLQANAVASLRKSRSKAKFFFIKCGLLVKHVFKGTYLENSIILACNHNENIMFSTLNMLRYLDC